VFAGKEREGIDMATLELAEKGTAFVMEILETALSDLKTERGGTDHRAVACEVAARNFLLTLQNCHAISFELFSCRVFSDKAAEKPVRLTTCRTHFPQ
jgi:hypothetical protein